MDKFAAHIITADAKAQGDPAVTIMTPDAGMGARVVESWPLDPSMSVLDVERNMDDTTDWRATGELVEVQTGYWVVDVERA